MTEKSKQSEVVDCPNHRDKICILGRLKKVKGSSGLVKSLKSETDDGLSSCSNFPERPTKDEMKSDKNGSAGDRTFKGQIDGRTARSHQGRTRAERGSFFET